jgi:hypothetical protein
MFPSDFWTSKPAIILFTIGFIIFDFVSGNMLNAILEIIFLIIVIFFFDEYENFNNHPLTIAVFALAVLIALGIIIYLLSTYILAFPSKL